MWEMQVLSTQKNAKENNGEAAVSATVTPGSNQSCPGSTAGSSAGSAGGECPSTGSEDSMSGAGVNEGGESPPSMVTGEHPALRGVQQGTQGDKTNHSYVYRNEY